MLPAAPGASAAARGAEPLCPAEGLSMLFARAVSGKSLRPLPGKKNKIVVQQRGQKS